MPGEGLEPSIPSRGTRSLVCAPAPACPRKWAYRRRRSGGVTVCVTTPGHDPHLEHRAPARSPRRYEARTVPLTRNRHHVHHAPHQSTRRLDGRGPAAADRTTTGARARREAKAKPESVSREAVAARAARLVTRPEGSSRGAGRCRCRALSVSGAPPRALPGRSHAQRWPPSWMPAEDTVSHAHRSPREGETAVGRQPGVPGQGHWRSARATESPLGRVLRREHSAEAGARH